VNRSGLLHDFYPTFNKPKPLSYMRKNNLKGYTIICLLLLSLSCRKDYERFDYFRNPLKGGCQVAEYHIPIYDSYFPPHFVFLFKKTFDSTGRIVKSIICNFWDEIPPKLVNTPEFRHNLLVVQKAMKVYLINQETEKAGTPDTVARITLNNDGRAISCAATGALNPDWMGNPPSSSIIFTRMTISSRLSLTTWTSQDPHL
jgi:hypothetical protein